MLVLDRRLDPDELIAQLGNFLELTEPDTQIEAELTRGVRIDLVAGLDHRPLGFL